MSYYDLYNQPDPEEERRKLEEMHRFAYGGDTPLPPELTSSPAPQQPIRAALESVQPPEQLDAGAPPEPDAERAAPILEGRTPVASPTPRMLEDDAIRAVRDSYGKKRGFWEDAAPAAIAVGLDALLNKSRGTGAIVGGYAQGVMRRDAEDKDKMRQLAQLEIQRARETASDAERAQNYEINKGNLEARNAELELARQRQLAEQGDPVSKRKLMEAQANVAESQAYKNWTTDPNAIDAETQARLTQQREMHDQDLADRQAARADSAATRATLAEQTAAQKAETQRSIQQTRDTTATNTFLGKTKDERAQAALLQGMQPIVNKPEYAGDLPGVGKLDSALPSWLMHPLDSQARDDATRMKQMAGEAQTYFRHQITGAAASPRELAALEGLKGLGGTEAEFKVALKTWQNMLQGDIRAAAAASPDNARNALDAQGLGGLLPPPPAAAQVAPPPVRLGGQRGVAGGGNNFGYSGPPAGDTLQTQPGTPPRVSDYLKKLQAEDDDLGVGYR